MISWTCFRSELTCKTTGADSGCVEVCVWLKTRTGSASKRCFYEPIKWHCYSIAWGTPGGKEQLKVGALQWPLSGSGITHSNFFFLKDRSFRLFCPLPRNRLVQLFPRAQFVSSGECQTVGYLNEKEWEENHKKRHRRALPSGGRSKVLACPTMF